MIGFAKSATMNDPGANHVRSDYTIIFLFDQTDWTMFMAATKDRDYTDGSLMKHVAVMSLASSVGIMAIYVVDLEVQCLLPASCLRACRQHGRCIEETNMQRARPMQTGEV